MENKEVIGQVENIEQKSGTSSSGKTWKRTAFTINGRKYSTFTDFSDVKVGDYVKTTYYDKVDGTTTYHTIIAIHSSSKEEGQTSFNGAFFGMIYNKSFDYVLQNAKTSNVSEFSVVLGEAFKKLYSHALELRNDTENGLKVPELPPQSQGDSGVQGVIDTLKENREKKDFLQKEDLEVKEEVLEL